MVDSAVAAQAGHVQPGAQHEFEQGLVVVFAVEDGGFDKAANVARARAAVGKAGAAGHAGDEAAVAV